MHPRASERTTWWAWPSLALAAVVAFAGCRAGAGDDPWLSLPPDPAETREARWATLVALADLPAERAPAADILERAAAAARSARDDVPDALRTALTTQPGVHVDALPPATAGALAGLVRWHAEGGSLGAEVCDLSSVPDSIALLDLARWALASSEDGGDPRVLAVLHLARHFGRDGVFIHGGVAQALFELLVDWAEARGIAPSEAWNANRPRGVDMARVMVREHVCMDRRLETVGLDRLFALWTESREVLRDLGAEIPDAKSLGSHRLSDSSVAREQAWVRSYHGARLAALAQSPDDRSLAYEAARVPDVASLPPSFVIRVSVHDVRFIVDRWYDTVTRFDAFLADAAAQ